jgi:AcrR family transcriptional regulator
VGKGTVYLYFDSKEDISLAIFVEYKLGIAREQEKIVSNPEMSLFCKIREFLLFPVLTANLRCEAYPEAVDVIKDLKPHLTEHMRPYLDREVALLAGLLSAGVEKGELDITDPLAAARSLKLMTLGFMPPYACVSGREAIEHEIDAMVRLALRGLLARPVLAGTIDKANCL